MALLILAITVVVVVVVSILIRGVDRAENIVTNARVIVIFIFFLHFYKGTKTKKLK